MSQKSLYFAVALAAFFSPIAAAQPSKSASDSPFDQFVAEAFGPEGILAPLPSQRALAVQKNQMLREASFHDGDHHGGEHHEGGHHDEGRHPSPERRSDPGPDQRSNSPQTGSGGGYENRAQGHAEWGSHGRWSWDRFHHPHWWGWLVWNGGDRAACLNYFLTARFNCGFSCSVENNACLQSCGGDQACAAQCADSNNFCNTTCFDDYSLNAASCPLD